jgi:hypothetical protein
VHLLEPTVADTGKCESELRNFKLSPHPFSDFRLDQSTRSTPAIAKQAITCSNKANNGKNTKHLGRL